MPVDPHYYRRRKTDLRYAIKMGILLGIAVLASGILELYKIGAFR